MLAQISGPSDSVITHVAARGPARVRGKTRATRATLALIITLTAGAVAASGTAAASPIAAKRAEAQQVEGQIQQAQSSLERQIEAYNKVHDDYAATKTKLRRSRQLLGVARANLGGAQKNLAASLTEAYKNGGNDDLAYLLALSSFSDLVDNVSVLEKASNASGQLLTTIVKYKKEVSTQEATLQTETAKLHQELGEMAQRKQAIESQISSLHAREAQISSDIKRLIDEEQRRQNAAAAAAAAAATGGSSSSSSSSSTGGDIPMPPSSTLGGQAVAIAEQYLGVPVRVGRREPRRLRLLGPRDVRLRAARCLAPAQRGRAVRRGAPARAAAAHSSPATWSSSTASATSASTSATALFIHAPHTGDGRPQISSHAPADYCVAFVGARRDRLQTSIIAAPGARASAPAVSPVSITCAWSSRRARRRLRRVQRLDDAVVVVGRARDDVGVVGERVPGERARHLVGERLHRVAQRRAVGRRQDHVVEQLVGL